MMRETIQQTQANLQTWFEQELEVTPTASAVIVAVISLGIVLLLAFIVDRLAGWTIRSFIPSIVGRFSSSNTQQWVTAIRERFVARRGAHIVAVLTLYWLTPYALSSFPDTLTVVQNLIEAYIVIVIVLAINSMLRASSDVLADSDMPAGISLRFATQGAQIIVWVVGSILVASVLLDTSVTILLSGMAGMTAVLLLVFKDSILGFVAGIQLANNDMLRIDDWIEVPQFGADGLVVDIGLTTVKVQNWDKTISTVPSYVLVSESFRNWRGMKECGARRILRAVSVDMDRISFLSDSQLDQLREIEVLRDYLNEKEQELTDFNKSICEDVRRPPNARRLTNIGVFRVYMEKYLRQHSELRSDMTLVVQQLPPGPDGLPIQVIVFCKHQELVDFERVQADLFDHAIAILPEFGLKAFQAPTNDDYMRKES